MELPGRKLIRKSKCESSLNVPLYLTMPGSGWGPWILLLATSKGMLQQEARVPAVNPIRNFLANSALQKEIHINVSLIADFNIWAPIQ